MRKILFMIILAIILAIVISLIFGILAIRRESGLSLITRFTTPAMAQDGECTTDKDKIYLCSPEAGCALSDENRLFQRTVDEIALEMGWPDNNYRPCYIKMTSTKDSYSFTVYHALEYQCDYYFRLCGITARDYVSGWTSGEQGDTLKLVIVYFERHLPISFPIILERSGWDNENWTRGDTILQVAPGYPPPIDDYPEPPYP